MFNLDYIQSSTKLDHQKGIQFHRDAVVRALSELKTFDPIRETPITLIFNRQNDIFTIKIFQTKSGALLAMLKLSGSQKANDYWVLKDMVRSKYLTRADKNNVNLTLAFMHAFKKMEISHSSARKIRINCFENAKGSISCEIWSPQYYDGLTYLYELDKNGRIKRKSRDEINRL